MTEMPTRNLDDTLSCRVKKSTLLAFKQRLPQQGERSLVIRKLIEMYLAGQVRVVIPSRVL
jgi:hypothetical protein